MAKLLRGAELPTSLAGSNRRLRGSPRRSLDLYSITPGRRHGQLFVTHENRFSRAYFKHSGLNGFHAISLADGNLIKLEY